MEYANKGEVEKARESFVSDAGKRGWYLNSREVKILRLPIGSAEDFCSTVLNSEF